SRLADLVMREQVRRAVRADGCHVRFDGSRDRAGGRRGMEFFRSDARASFQCEASVAFRRIDLPKREGKIGELFNELAFLAVPISWVVPASFSTQPARGTHPLAADPYPRAR